MEAILVAVADHNARIVALEHDRDMTDASLLRVEDKVDKLKYWMMSTLAAALGGIITHFIGR